MSKTSIDTHQHAVIDVSRFIDCGEEILAGQPELRSVAFTGLVGGLDRSGFAVLETPPRADEIESLLGQLASCPHLARLSAIALDEVGISWVRDSVFDSFGFDSLGDVAARRLAGSPYLSRLRELSISHVGVDGLRALARCNALESLETLRLRAQRFGRALVRELLDAPLARKLRVLSLCGENGSWRHVLGGHVSSMLDHPRLAQLEELDLRWNDLCDSDLEYMSIADGLGQLQRLLLGYGSYGPHGLRALGESSSLRSLRELDLSEHHVEDAGALVIASGQAFAGLERLTLYGCYLTEAGARALVRSPHLRRLRSLDLRGNWRVQHMAEELGSELRAEVLV